MSKIEDFIIICIPLIFLSNNLFSQVKTDSLSKNYISPRSAMIRSAIIPGWGQWSNGKRLKSFLVASVESYLIVRFVDYYQKYSKTEDEKEKEFFRDQRSKYGWWLLLAYILSLMDAYVDAYLKDFNKNMDINYSRLNFSMNFLQRSRHPGEMHIFSLLVSFENKTLR